MNKYRTFVPPVKCQGIKTKLVPWIQAVTPSDFKGRWIEPFMGSGVVAFNIRPRRALLADSNPHLINFYKAVARKRITSSTVRQFLYEEGVRLSRSSGEHYYVVRERFNQLNDPMDFLFLNRACFNGLIRFNRGGKFNVPFCHKPNRFSQAYITKIANQVQMVSDVVGSGEYEFVCQDFSTTIPIAECGDLIYCDPPYIARHADYFNKWGEEHEIELSKLLSSVPCRFVLSTWQSSSYRANSFIDTLWSNFYLMTRKHFYYVGAKEKNRNPIIEALIMNFRAELQLARNETVGQFQLLETAARYTGPPSQPVP